MCLFIYLFYIALSNIDFTYVPLLSDSTLEDKRMIVALYKRMKTSGDYIQKYKLKCHVYLRFVTECTDVFQMTLAIDAVLTASRNTI